jgi:hypothetical protein
MSHPCRFEPNGLNSLDAFARPWSDSPPARRFARLDDRDGPGPAFRRPVPAHRRRHGRAGWARSLRFRLGVGSNGFVSTRGRRGGSFLGISGAGRARVDESTGSRHRPRHRVSGGPFPAERSAARVRAGRGSSRVGRDIQTHPRIHRKRWPMGRGRTFSQRVGKRSAWAPESLSSRRIAARWAWARIWAASSHWIFRSGKFSSPSRFRIRWRRSEPTSAFSSSARHAAPGVFRTAPFADSTHPNHPTYPAESVCDAGLKPALRRVSRTRGLR